MFSHIMVGAHDLAASKAFYDAVFGALGIGPGTEDGNGRAFYANQSGAFGVGAPANGQAATAANGGTIAFVASSPSEVDAWHAAGLANGGTTCENPPGIRDFGGAGRVYAAYLRDPAGNKLCAAHRMAS